MRLVENNPAVKRHQSAAIREVTSTKELLAFERMLGDLSARFTNISIEQVEAEIELAQPFLWKFLGFDLWKLDQVVFNVRRLCRPLETHFLGERIAGVPDDSMRRRLLKDKPSAWTLNCKLEATIEGRRGKTLKHALLNWNFAFAPDDYAHTRTDYRSASNNSVLIRRIYDPLEGGTENFAEADKLWDWIKTNIQLPNKKPNDLVAEIEIERARIKAKSVP